MSSKNWQFVSTNGGGKADDEQSRRIIRENAMRDFRRSERLARMKEFEKQKQAQSGTEHASTHRDADAMANRNREQQAHHDQEVVLRGCFDRSWEIMSLKGPGLGFDPFTSTVLPDHHDSQQLFHHFVHRIAPKLQPVGSNLSRISINYFLARQILEDSGLLSTVLFHAGLHTDALSGKLWSAPTLYHHGETVRILNERLRSPQNAISDSSVAMVGFLAASGNITGDTQSDMAHTQALQDMIRMRGGLSNLGWQGVLAMLLLVGDSIRATISDSRPNLSAPDIRSNRLVAELPPSILQPAPPTIDTASLGREIRTMMGIITPLASTQLRLLKDPSTTISSVLSLTDLIVAVEHRLFNIKVPSPFPPEPQALLYDSARLALTICMSCNFRDFRPLSATLMGLQKRLMPILKSLESLYGDMTDTHQRRMLLWILWVGGIASVNQEWYAKRISVLMLELGLAEVEELRNCFREFVWSPRMDDQFSYSLWELVQSKMTLSKID
ncbi:uncharacterized protein BDR25DRAFT_342371 [Lindgomyces ingoldianus]|uniref:Uncharacterized protein n=1 Tax=Lindgomyces ingoldianus TaxID=673940 RepID=A0ACB6QXY3_9PLEO|nr:uncharacterized protein BDR25DRAFT_342371 [Lindgomyces ingoldianus]KAF2471677.1 hypothetical protein BDR25DRAFT_342371 [Lindgomyces ingoldianus]